jgi:hypothetical protein
VFAASFEAENATGFAVAAAGINQMGPHESLPTEYAPEAAAAPADTSGALAKRVGWTLLGSGIGRFFVLAVCQQMSRNLERRRGAPAVESRHGVVRLWRIERFRDVSWLPQQPWTLHDGVRLQPDDPVLEFHIAGDRFIRLLHNAQWRTVVAQEFHSMVSALQVRDEVALVGSTILRRQVSDFGASLRELPPGLHRSLDTFYRKLILLAFHPGGARRVLLEHRPVVEAAISRREFCRRFYGDGAS